MALDCDSVTREMFRGRTSEARRQPSYSHRNELIATIHEESNGVQLQSAPCASRMRSKGTAHIHRDTNCTTVCCKCVRTSTGTTIRSTVCRKCVRTCTGTTICATVRCECVPRHQESPRTRQGDPPSSQTTNSRTMRIKMSVVCPEADRDKQPGTPRAWRARRTHARTQRPTQCPACVTKHTETNQQNVTHHGLQMSSQ